ncbi:MAG: pilin [Candidatus Komeilibacteria bacterium]|nr:pilin [Candidatus Komeilibacteria bacterium]
MKTISKITTGLIFFWLLAILFLPTFAQADDCPAPACLAPDGVTCQNPCPPAANTPDVKLENPLGAGINTPTQLYARIIYSFMGMTGVVALIIFIIGGYQWMTAGGNAEKVKKGLDTIIWAIFGIIVIFASYAILRAVFETLRF